VKNKCFITRLEPQEIILRRLYDFILNTNAHAQDVVTVYKSSDSVLNRICYFDNEMHSNLLPAVTSNYWPAVQVNEIHAG